MAISGRRHFPLSAARYYREEESLTVRRRIQMLKIAFINEAVTLLEEADPQDYEAIISILLAYAGRRRTNAQ